LELADNFDIKGIAHITGGGFIENIPRTIPAGLKAEVNLGSFPILPIFKLMQKLGDIEDKEMFNTFNMGIGLVIVINKDEVEEMMSSLSRMNQKAYIIGKIIKGDGGIELCQS
jgi:phosphoribosylformylglycinamidine cyclo-ligase